VIALFSLPLFIAFWVLMLVLLLLVVTIAVWIAVAVVLAIVETRRAHRERPEEESSTADDPFSVLRESAIVAPEVIGRTPQGDTP
jgi:pilus assembly protein TadC